MTQISGSFLEVQKYSPIAIFNLFKKAKAIKNEGFTGSLAGKLIAFFFLEPSTRTRLSFETAALRTGAKTFALDSTEASSLSKGESLEDTFWAIHAMAPDLIIVRSGTEFPLEELVSKANMPIVNAGHGHFSHPTQALIDAYSLWERWGSLENKRILLFGDVGYSRVARSNVLLLQKLGAKIGLWSPNVSEDYAQVETFSTFDEGLKWCDACMGLRTQWERHKGMDLQQVVDTFQLNKKGLEQLSPQALIMHPGPVRWGEEFSVDVQADSRQIIWDQIANGVFVRAALMQSLLEKI